MGEIMVTIKIEKLDHQGRGMARIHEKTFFIPNTLPEELVEACIVEEKKNYGIAEVTSIIESSKKRIHPVCPYFDNCGGCDLMHLSYQDQIQFKQNKIVDIMRKFAGVNQDKIKSIIFSNNPLYYRNKVTFQYDNYVGFYGKKSHDVVAIDHCFIATVKINKILEKIKQLSLNHVERVVVKADDKIKEAMIIFEGNDLIAEQEYVEKLKDIVTSIIIVKNGREKVIYGSDCILFPLNQYQFEVSPSSFFQVNLEQCEKLYQKVVESADITTEDVVLDLYCGTGTIGIYVSKFAKKVYGVEINCDAVRNANKNKKRNHIENIEFFCGDCGKIVPKLKIRPTIVIVDPPRKGLDKNTVTQLLKWNCRKIVYVSCDPMTLARDLKLLQEKYEVIEITPVDMFPNTSHVECCTLLSLKGTEKNQ